MCTGTRVMRANNARDCRDGIIAIAGEPAASRAPPASVRRGVRPGGSDS